jgi:hypothetical protein
MSTQANGLYYWLRSLSVLKDILKFIYYFMILLLILYILNIFYCYYHLVTEGVRSHFNFDYFFALIEINM